MIKYFRWCGKLIKEIYVIIDNVNFNLMLLKFDSVFVFMVMVGKGFNLIVLFVGEGNDLLFNEFFR